ncbi:MAG: RHS repeat-associated core domain-containing protein, partial [Chloroflexota bacterium]
MRLKQKSSKVFLAMICFLLALGTAAILGIQPEPTLADGPELLDIPGRKMAIAPQVSPSEARAILLNNEASLTTANDNLSSASLEIAALLSSETEASPEIKALARALQHDPMQIYDYVRNNFEYIPNFGSANGATATLQAHKGNDWDQTSLFIALMRESGFTANYVVGDVVYSTDRLANWLGVNSSETGNVIASGGIPIAGVVGGFQIQRVWAEAVIDGQTYTFDPAMKEHRLFNKIDLNTAASYNQATFMANAQVGATVTSTSTKNINNANIRADLMTMSMNLVNHIRTNNPEAKVVEVIGGQEIIATKTTAYSSELPFAISKANEVTHATIPAGFRKTLRIEHKGIDHTFNTYEIAGKRVSIFYRAGDKAPELRVDGELIATGEATTMGTRYAMTVTINHPYAASGGAYGDETGIFSYLHNEGSYVLVHDFNTSSESLLNRRNRTFAQTLANNPSTTDEEILGEGLNLTGVFYSHQTDLYDRLVAQVGDVVTIRHHLGGLIFQQDNGYGIDMVLGFNSNVSTNGTSQSKPVSRAQTLMSSSFEHGIFEQLQGSSNPAVSTIKLIKTNVTSGTNIYLADSSTWDSIKGELVDYDAGLLAFLDVLIANSSDLLLPKDGDIEINDYHGVGFVNHRDSGGSAIGMAMIISGGLNGGNGALNQDFNARVVQQFLANNGFPADMQFSTITPLNADPIDMVGGSFVDELPSMSNGLWSSGPLSLPFVRSYNSNSNFDVGPLGQGWSHNYDVNVTTYSNGNIGLGLRQPVDVASALVTALVTHDLLSNQLNSAGWTASVLAAQWGMDELTDNITNVSFFNEVLEYTKLADGTFAPPPGVRMDLIKSGNYFYLKGDDRRGAFTFDSTGKWRAWQDTDDNTLTLTYSGNNLQTVTSSLGGQTLNFVYSGSNVTGVTNSAGHSLGFSYTGDNLTTYTDAENKNWVYTYDAFNRLASIKNPENNTVATNIYDSFGQVATQTDSLANIWQVAFSDFESSLNQPDNHDIEYKYDDEGQMLEREDGAGNASTLAYNGQGQVTRVTDRLGNSTSFTYNAASNKVATITNGKNDTISFTYTPQAHNFTNPVDGGQNFNLTYHNLTRRDFPDGANDHFGYDGDNNLTTYTDRGGHIWSLGYNTIGQLNKITFPAIAGNGVVDITYNVNGTVASVTDSDTGNTTFGYDTDLRPTTITHPGGTITSAYNKRDQLTSITDERSNTTAYGYDNNGNLTTITDPDTNTQTFGYDAMDRVNAYTDERNKTTNYLYDGTGNLTKITDPNNNIVQFQYDTRDWLTIIIDGLNKNWNIGRNAERLITSVTTPLNQVTQLGYDALGYITSITSPLNNTTTLTRDSLSRVTAIQDPLNRTTTYNYNSRGLLTGVTLPNGGGSTSYTYNSLGLLATVQDLGNNTWTFGYTDMGRRTRITDPLNNNWGYTYNNRGLLNQTTYPTGDTLTYSYDPANNITQKQYSAGLTLNYTYDKLNRLLTTNDLTLTRNERGQVTNTQNPPTSFGATYDDGGRIQTVSYNDGLFTVTYTYNARNQVTHVTDSLTGTTIQFIYDDDGRIKGIQRPNGVNATITLDNDSRVTRIQEGALADMQYKYNGADEVTEATLNLPINPVDHLTDTITSLTVDKAGQITTAGYAYDTQGRLTASPDHTYSWDGASRLVQVDNTTLAYNGMGDVMTRTVGSSTTHYYYNYALGMHPIVGEKDEGSGQWQRYYVLTPEGRLLYLIDAANGNTVSFYHYDSGGDTMFLTDVAGAVSDAYAYDPFGKLLHHQGSSDQPFTFGGAWQTRREGNDNLYQIRARYYDANAARFISREPLWPQIDIPKALNVYEYGYNNPMVYVDIDGLRARP